MNLQHSSQRNGENMPVPRPGLGTETPLPLCCFGKAKAQDESRFKDGKIPIFLLEKLNTHIGKGDVDIERNG